VWCGETMADDLTNIRPILLHWKCVDVSVSGFGSIQAQHMASLHIGSVCVRIVRQLDRPTYGGLHLGSVGVSVRVAACSQVRANIQPSLQ
jgi:hypothetical protein